MSQNPATTPPAASAAAVAEPESLALMEFRASLGDRVIEAAMQNRRFILTRGNARKEAAGLVPMADMDKLEALDAAGIHDIEDLRNVLRAAGRAA